MSSITDLHQQLETLRPGLFRFAQLQLRNESAAEDAVQETLLAVLEKPDSFAGNSSLRTYVTGILKFKIIDHLRSLKKEKPLETKEDESEDDLIDSLFNANGHVIGNPPSWGAPEAALQQKDFFRVLEVCLENLPAKTARVFMMREWLELETEEICKELELTTSNLWVVLYRARLRLRECLDLNWFGHK
ncbi:sigma-70 family RNA polymerase sigma factor [Undibacterium sp. Ji49W]